MPTWQAYYSFVLLRGTFISDSHALDLGNTPNTGAWTGSGGGVFALESVVELHGGPSGRRATITGCTARDTDGYSFGGAIMFYMSTVWASHFLDTWLSLNSAGRLPMGPHPMGPHPMGPHPMGPHPVGPHPVGPHPTGPHRTGPHP